MRAQSRRKERPNSRDDDKDKNKLYNSRRIPKEKEEKLAVHERKKTRK